MPQKGTASPTSTPLTTKSSESTRRKKLQRPSYRKLKHQTLANLNKINLSKRSKVIIGATLVIIIACIVVGFINRENSTDDASRQGSGQILENLEYQTVLPAGKSITDLGGWRRVSPPDGDPVYAFTDTLEGVSISVSEQPLPESSRGNASSSLADIAKNLNATTKLDGGDTEIYIGNNSQGPQSVVFTKNYLLILIKSQNKISDTAWIQYINTLR